MTPNPEDDQQSVEPFDEDDAPEPDGIPAEDDNEPEPNIEPNGISQG